MTHFDLLIIGTGSGNTIANHRFDSLRVAIAEEWHFGGTCLNVGCIPTKMFVHTADVAEAAGNSAKFGIDTQFNSADWPAIRDRIFARIDPIEAGGRDYRSNQLANVTVFSEHVHFTAPGQFMTASGQEFSADRVIIAAGAHPMIPQLDGLDVDRVDTAGYPVMTSDSVMRLPQLPASMLVIGGGFIAMELAHVFYALGTEVTVAVRSDALLRANDAEVVARFTAEFSAHHRVFFGTSVTAVDVTDSAPQVTATFAASGKAEQSSDVPAHMQFDAVLLAMGRTPSSQGLHPQAAGIDVLPDQRIAVDDYGRVLAGGTPLPGAYALGDICSPFMLKHVANHEARVVKANILADIASGSIGGAKESQLQKFNHHAVPAAVFSSPQVACVGLTEKQARDTGRPLAIKVQEYADVAYGWALEDKVGMVKVIADRETGQLLGAHVLGAEASMIIQSLITALAFDIPARTFATDQYWIHPALPEVVENALLGLAINQPGAEG